MGNQSGLANDYATAEATTGYFLSYEAVTEMIATISAEISTLNKLLERKDVVDCDLNFDIDEMIRSRNSSRDSLKEKLRLASNRTLPQFNDASLAKVSNRKIKLDEQIEVLISMMTSNSISEKLRDEFRVMVKEKEVTKKELSELEVKIKSSIEIEVEISL